MDSCQIFVEFEFWSQMNQIQPNCMKLKVINMLLQLLDVLYCLDWKSHWNNIKIDENGPKNQKLKLQCLTLDSGDANVHHWYERDHHHESFKSPMVLSPIDGQNHWIEQRKIRVVLWPIWVAIGMAKLDCPLVLAIGCLNPIVNGSTK